MRQCCVRLGKAGIELERASDFCKGLRSRLTIRYRTIRTETNVGAGSGGVSRRMLRILLKRAFEGLERLIGAASTILVEMGPAEQIGLLCSGVALTLSATQARRLCWRHSRSYGFGD